MKYIRLFNTTAERDSYLNGGGVYFPTVSAIRGMKDVFFKRRAISLITFTLTTEGGVELDFGPFTYQAEEGMTWEEFINSEYNTDGKIYMREDTIYFKENDEYYDFIIRDRITLMSISPTDTIINGQTYIIL